ncbi:putative class III chitinase [Polyplosphaeria fusca]|uniref:chitinase n=1 Tax=Polyplosphaeria fusca TaxID=682080 RepID=A0A9P4R362_9PLEO|nr:putative class III chitinase [Polyplosphaeria fusca]
MLAGAGVALAGYDNESRSNIAVYWGQNSVNLPTSQDRLSKYCEDSDVDIIILSFLTKFEDLGGLPKLNFANQGTPCTVIPGSSLFNCPELETDIQDCQIKHNKTILLSIGGAAFLDTGFADANAANTTAYKIWSLFGPPSPNYQTEPRPFGYASVDGFDLDIESPVSNIGLFAKFLRAAMDSYHGQNNRQFYLTAAPQCLFEDAYLKDVYNTVPLDILMVQFYNNDECGITSYVSGDGENQKKFSLANWDTWAKNTAPKKDIKIFVGVPGNTKAGVGYLSAGELAPVIEFAKNYSSFGGVMVWDASQAWANTGFLSSVKGTLSDRGPQRRMGRYGRWVGEEMSVSGAETAPGEVM